MFTGIVREVGTVASFEDGRLVVEAPIAAGLGDSVAIDGVCLTVVEDGGGRARLRRRAGDARRASKPFGDRVNLEPALRAGEPLGGHFVQGHVDGVGTVALGRARGRRRARPVERARRSLRYCVEKGSITVDGVSLTVARARPRPASRSR